MYSGCLLYISTGVWVLPFQNMVEICFFNVFSAKKLKIGRKSRKIYAKFDKNDFFFSLHAFLGFYFQKKLMIGQIPMTSFFGNLRVFVAHFGIFQARFLLWNWTMKMPWIFWHFVVQILAFWFCEIDPRGPQVLPKNKI